MDITYDKDTCLIDMLMSQLEFQRQLLKKRNITAPDDVMTAANKKLEEACYHATCTNVELAEFIEQLTADGMQITDEVLLELTDAFTFLLNQLLYINILPTKTLSYYMRRAKARYDSRDNLAHKPFTYTEIIGLYNIAIGDLYHKTRYKSWKTYAELDDNVYELVPLVDEVLSTFMMLYIKAGVTDETIVDFFYRKHEINKQRQEVGGKYEQA